MVTRRDARRVLYVGTIVALAIAPWPFFGDPRFHLPVSFLLTLPAAVTLVGLPRVPTPDGLVTQRVISPWRFSRRVLRSRRPLLPPGDRA